MGGDEHQPRPPGGDARVDLREPRVRARGVAARRPTSTASTTVLPISTMRSGATCSPPSASAARRVGARCRSATTPTSRRLASSGNGARDPGSQARLEVHQRNPPPERDEAADQHRRGVALHDDGGRAVAGSTRSSAGASSATSSTCSPVQPVAARGSRRVAGRRWPAPRSPSWCVDRWQPPPDRPARNTERRDDGAILTASGRVPTTT